MLPFLPSATSARTRGGHGLVAVVALSLAFAAARPAAAQMTEERRQELFDAIEWLEGPGKGELGDVADLRVPGDCRFTREAGAAAFMEATENPPSGTELGVLVCTSQSPGNPAQTSRWFVVFEYDASGYVKDDEKEELNAGEILETLRDGQTEGNKERRRLGFDELTLDGWIRPPYYDERTNNLTWALRVLSNSDSSVNHSVRLLGRGGVLKADLVSSPGTFEMALPLFEQVVDATSFVPGQKYAEWREGDKVAAYGLTALVAGGAGAAAMKLGLFGKLWKIIVAGAKAIVVGVVAFFAWLRNLFKRKRESASGPAPSTSSA